MSHSHAADVFMGPGGERTERPPIIVEAGQEHTISGTHNGGVCVHERGTAAIAKFATHNGSLRVEGGALAVVHGTHNGSISVSSGGVVEITGRQNGSVTVDTGGVVRLAEGAVAAGSLHIDGRFENAGTRGGSVSGNGDVVDLPGSAVRQPIVRDGNNYYNL